MSNQNKPDVDWEKIELDYRAGLKTLRKIASEHCFTHGAIYKRAKRNNWTRDLTAKIKEAAKTKVSKAAVSKEVSKRAKAVEREVVEANSDLVSSVHLSHRQDIPRKKELVTKLFAEIEAITDNGDLIKRCVTALKKGDMKKLAESIKKVTSLPTRIKGASELINAYKTIITLERQTFGLDDSGSSEVDNLSLFLEEVRRRNKPMVNDDERK